MTDAVYPRPEGDLNLLLWIMTSKGVTGRWMRFAELPAVGDRFAVAREGAATVTAVALEGGSGLVRMRAEW